MQLGVTLQRGGNFRFNKQSNKYLIGKYNFQCHNWAEIVTSYSYELYCLDAGTIETLEPFEYKPPTAETTTTTTTTTSKPTEKALPTTTQGKINTGKQVDDSNRTGRQRCIAGMRRVVYASLCRENGARQNSRQAHKRFCG